MLTVSDNHIVLGGGSSGGGGSTTFAGLSDKATADIPAINTPTATALLARELIDNKKTDVGANKTSDTFFPTVKAVFDWVSGLFVKGAASSTDNALVRWDGTSGKLIKNSSIFITDAGKVGIGIASPARILHTVGDVVRFDRGGQSFEINPNYGNENTHAAFYASRAMTFYVNAMSAAIEAVKVDITGNVGIGTTSPTTKLDVDGTSRFRGNATFNGQIIDNAGSSGTDGQVLKKVGGLVIWANP